VGKNVAVYVDVANIFYAAKAAGVDIDYVTLLKAATAGRDFVRAYAYTGLDPENENQRNFHNFLARHGYKVVSKDIRKYGDGKVKANLDIELVVDMMKTARNLDVAVLVSGDGDFAPAIRAVQEMGVRVEVISFRGNTSSDLIDVADSFADITSLARVEKGSSRSGRRVAGDDEDLSMTEVPDKQTEGSGRGRGRGREGGREPVRSRSRSGGSLVALPGERLSKAATADGDGEAAVAAEDIEDVRVAADGDVEGEEGRRRRRRRRGGRGRGRGRGGDAIPVGEDADAPSSELERAGLPEAAPSPRARAPRPGAFGSVWDSQIGMPTGPTSSLAPGEGDEDFEEPEIPEYLIAEQRRGSRGGRGGAGHSRGGPRGGRSAYVAALERERFGGGRSSSIDRYPGGSDRGGDRGGGMRREPPRRPERSAPRSSSEPWSEVPPELEEMLRAQLAARQSTPAAAPSRSVEVRAEPEREAAAASPRRRSTRGAAAAADDGDGETTAAVAGPTDAAAVDAEAKPKRRATRKATAASSGESAVEAEAKPKRRTTRKATARAAGDGGDVASSEASAADAGAKPKRRTTRKTADA
jgi:uncharacterized LabA/DUF88 family protein